MPKPSYPYEKPIRSEYDIIQRYQVVRKAAPPPQTDIFDEPRVCLPVNEQWLPHVFGVIDMLNEPDSWLLDAFTARQQIEKLIHAAVSPSNPCKPATIIRRVPQPVLPAGMRADACGLIIDERQICYDIHIITEAPLADFAPGGELCPPESWRLPAGGGGGNDVSAAIDINLLQQQIDALQNEINAADAAITQLQADLADVSDARQINTSSIFDLQEDIRIHDEHLIGSVRWYPGNAVIPDGWVAFSGQRIPKFPTVTTHSVLLYDRSPSAWRDGDDVVLPNNPQLNPGNIFGAFQGVFGGTRELFLSRTGVATEQTFWTSGRWYIYIGEAVII